MNRYQNTSLAEALDVIRNTSTAQELLSMLDERHRIFCDRGMNEVMLIRGHILASLPEKTPPAIALVYIFEELENSKHPHPVAGAAIALRNIKIPGWQGIPYLLKAVKNIQHHDDRISLGLNGGQVIVTSAMSELFATLEQYSQNEIAPFYEHLRLFQATASPLNKEMSARLELLAAMAGQAKSTTDGDCCTINFSGGYQENKVNKVTPPQSIFEDQDGQSVRFLDFFGGQPAIVAFFYTRCENPNKCAMTMTRLGFLQRQLRSRSGTCVRVAAITYDPEYDRPHRLKLYAELRGLELGED
ncbi:MAG: SCO family protein [Bacteroidota bacterium]